MLGMNAQMLQICGEPSKDFIVSLLCQSMNVGGLVGMADLALCNN